MKKILFFASALAGLLLAGSCQREELAPATEGNTVTFTVEIPEVATKAAAVGNEANMINDLVYAVYKTSSGSVADALTNWNANTTFLYAQNYTSNPFDNGSATISLELLNDQNHIVLLWAQNQDTWVNTFDDEIDLTNISYPANLKVENTEDPDKYAAFSTVKFISANDKANTNPIVLTRPFAQINIATLDPTNYDVAIDGTVITINGAGSAFNVASQLPADHADVTYTWTGKVSADPLTVNSQDYDHYLAMGYVFANDAVSVDYTITTSNHGVIGNNIPNVPVAKNYRTNIIGNLLTSDVKYNVTLDKNWEAEYNVSPEGDVVKNTYVESASEILEIIETLNNPNENVQSAIITLNDDINLNDLITTRSEASTDPSVKITSGNSLILDLNGKKLSATSSQTGKNYNMFDVIGILTVKNGTIEYEHKGENMGWAASTNIFNVTAGGVLNLEGVTAKNLGGSDMGFVAHLNNWGEVTLNAENCTLESNYVPVRVFNSGYDMNNVTIKNSTLKGNSAAFWVHNYTVEDFGSAEKAEAQKALLNLTIYAQGNTFSPDVNGVRYGFTNSVRSDAYGITKTVSEDGTVVTLGSVVENGLVRRGVAGDEENTTITKAIVGEGITTLYDRTFRRFYALETVELPSTLTTISAAGSGVFQSCTALKNITLPESVTVIGKGTFQECSSLESINIPSGVTRIEADALRATGLVSVEFHEGVTYFGAQAFRDCKQLKEVIINAPSFTVEPNAFGVMAGALPGTTIYVANAEMKAYLESTLAYKNQFTIVAPTVPETGAKAAEALKNGENVSLAANLTFSANDTPDTGYGKAGLIVSGSVLNGNGHTIKADNAWGTWDCTISAESGTIKNATISGAFRGIFMPGANGDVYIDNVTFENVIYTFNSDAGDKNYGVYISNSTLNGWTSFSDCHKEVVFTNCSFGEGNGNAFCRPYNACVFENCEFSTDMEFDTSKQASIVFKNCTYGGVKITTENAASLKTGDVTFFYNGVGSVTFE